MSLLNRLLPALAALAIALPALTQEPPPAPDRPLPDAAQEARAQALFDRIRCVVCQHEAIADSPAVIASDMRQLVRDQIAAGRSDAEIREDLVRRYGDFVLFQPPVRFGTWLLWFGPVTLLAGVLALLLWRSRGRRGEGAPPAPGGGGRAAGIFAPTDLSPPSDPKAAYG